MISKTVRAVLRPVADLALRAWGRMNAANYDISRTIVLACSPRGGSNWLAQIVTALPGYCLIVEPLHLNMRPECREFGFGWYTYVPPGAKEPLKCAYLRRVFKGSNLHIGMTLPRFPRLEHLLRFRGYVIKFCRANLLLPWLAKEFNQKIILMFRHPCAVVSSQLRFGGKGWGDVSKDTYRLSSGLAADYPRLEEVSHTLKTREQFLAFTWALQAYIPLVQPKPYPWYLTTYEKLVDEGPSEVDRIFGYLNCDVPPEAYGRLKIPAPMTMPDSNVAKGKSPLTGWKSALTPRQIDDILGVVRRVGIDFYSDSLRPDYERLNAWPKQAE